MSDQETPEFDVYYAIQMVLIVLGGIISLWAWYQLLIW